ncbi:MAG: response regulator [Candidatus Acidiferrales bacterium]
MAKLRLLIADDHDIVRKGLCDLLRGQPGWEICCEARNGREAIRQAAERCPDVIVMDIAMPFLNGLEATRQITKHLPTAKVLILTVHESNVLVQQILQAGARGYLLKTDAGAELIRAVEILSRNQAYFSPRVATTVLESFLQKSAAQPAFEAQNASMTAREREIIQLLAEGKSNKEVASVLNLTVKTAETHRANIMRKLNSHSVSDLVRYAVRNQMIQV